MSERMCLTLGMRSLALKSDAKCESVLTSNRTPLPTALLWSATTSAPDRSSGRSLYSYIGSRAGIDWKELEWTGILDRTGTHWNLGQDEVNSCMRGAETG